MHLNVFGTGLVVVSIALMSGCENDSKKKSESKKTANKTSKKNGEQTKIVKKEMGTKAKSSPSKKGKTDDKKSTKIVKKSFSSGSSNTFATKSFGGGSSRTTSLTKSVIGYAQESHEVNPTVLMWIFDETRSAKKLREKVISEIKLTKETKFESAVFSFSSAGVTAHTTSPVANADETRKAVEKIEGVEDERESTFKSVHEIIAKNQNIVTSSGKKLICVLVTDESGDDALTQIDNMPAVDAVIDQLKRHSVTLFTIGYAAPFGRESDLVEGKQPQTKYGPETVYPQRLSLAMWNASTDIFRYDSGYGPWALEKLCRGTGGRFLADRPAEKSMRLVSKMQSNWPAVTSRQFDDSTMAPYRPFYGSASEYMAEVNSNSAKLALHNAAKLPFTKVFRIQDYEFRQTSEAELNRQINMTQRVPAIILPGLEKLYNILKAGEKDRDSITSKRWQASYDLAYGRTMANYVRVIGLNSMLAELKGGKSFTDSSNNAWTLVPHDEISTGTGNKKMADKAKLYLERVIEDHPKTPWALIAAKELESPMGWKWEESKR